MPEELPKKSGFEYDGVFVSWHLTDKVVDLQLVDQFSKMPPADFFAAVEDDFDRERTPILSAMIATSLRHHYQNWSVARVTRYVENMHMSQVLFFDGEENEPEVEGLPLEEKQDIPSEGDEASEDSSTKSSEPADTP
jgi:hypothetical protein